MKKHHLKLQASEQAVLNAAAQILSAFIISGQFKNGQEKEFTDKSVKLAIALAEHVDQDIVADEEIPS
ncbi:MAG: hypothetical protein JWM68_1964 [Verrucomicrobiales bacterium]|nr:hypothetical protein [Verrucomicrobiales bacterium]